MPLQIDAVLTSHQPRAVCIPCLAATTERDERDVRQAVMTLVMERRAETQMASVRTALRQPSLCGAADLAQMPTVTVSHRVLEALGVTLTDGDDLTDEQKRTLEPLLTSRGFAIAAPVVATRLPADRGFLLTQ